MTLPRQILPGERYLLTRRCTQREFLLTPSGLTNQILLYCLGVASMQTGIQLHSVCFMSNHWHGVVTDPQARLPEFLERFHRLVARALNAVLGRCENFWSSEKPSVVRLASDQDVLDKMAYTVANPSAAGLVQSPDDWPGIVSKGFCETWRVARPKVFFNPKGGLPEISQVTLVRPAIFSDLSDESLRQRLCAATSALIEAAKRRFEQARKMFVGGDVVVAQSPNRQPATSHEKRRAKPCVAAQDPTQRAHLVARLAAFVRSYREAFAAWRAGQRQVMFPAGTYALRVHAGVVCAPTDLVFVPP